ncbi:MAG TPA: alpha/beta hydrolase [Acidobacteria bacterium]|nr:alpha/beta hydrolase [Acidobacteriota bacterium]
MIDWRFDGPETGPVLVLAHGAGAPMDSPPLEALAKGLGAAGLRVARFEFPYMRARRTEARRRPPDRESVLLDTWRAAVAELGGGGGLVLAGKSMGGRMASRIADEVGARGLVCFGYPFHPPGQPAKTRTAHLEDLKTPTLIVQGTRDAFGTPEDVAAYRLSPAIRLVWLEDGDHSFKPRAASGRTEAQNLREAVEAAAGFVLARP